MEKRSYLNLHIVPARSQIEKSQLDCTCLSVLMHSCFSRHLLYVFKFILADDHKYNIMSAYVLYSNW